ncbi:ABC transporter permease [Parabacteroides sp.]
MFKHICKIIWKQRRANGWIFAELLVVISAVWYMAENMYVDLVTYHSPLGYDITDCWRFKLGDLNEKAPNFVPADQYTSTPTDDLRRLMDQIRLQPEVEGVCVSYYSCPYSHGNSWASIVPLDGDTTIFTQQSFQVRRVSAEYFDLFDVRDKNGDRLSERLKGLYNPIVVSVDMEEKMFHGGDAKGHKVSLSFSDQELTVAGTCRLIRFDEYSRAEPCFYAVMEGPYFNSCVDYFGASGAELCVKMRRPMSKADMDKMLESMGDRLTVNNLNVYGVRAISEFRNDQLSAKNEDMSRSMALMLFLLLNVFFGIVGTFWLRTQGRQGEIGLRVALGSSRFALKRFMYMEGLCLLLFTLPFELIFAVNMIYLDKLDTFRIPLGAGRFLITFGGTYLLMAAMICIGIWFPVRKAVKMNPAEALHYE